MPLVKNCTAHALYELLDELGVDTGELRQKKATFKELEETYLAHLNKKLCDLSGSRPR